MDRDLRDWLRGLASPTSEPHRRGVKTADLSDEGTEYLVRIAVDGTLKAALDEISTGEPELAG